MGRPEGLESMKRLTTNHHRTTMARVCRVENIMDGILCIDCVNNLRLYGVLRYACLTENMLRAREHRFGRLCNCLNPPGLFCFETRLFLLFFLRISRTAEFQECSRQGRQGVQKAHTKALASTNDASHVGYSTV